jgi:hypothetical protein
MIANCMITGGMLMVSFQGLLWTCGDLLFSHTSFLPVTK